MKNSLLEAALLHRQSHRKLATVFNQILEKYNLSTLEWTLLHTLKQNPTSNMSQIAQSLQVEKPMVSQLRRTLKKKNYITITVNEADARGRKIKLTENGAQALEQATQKTATVMGSIFSDIDPEKINNYLEVLQHIAQS